MKDRVGRVQQAAGRSESIGLRAGRLARRGRGGIPLANGFLWCRGPPDSAKTLVSNRPDNPTDFSLRFFTPLAEAWTSEICPEPDHVHPRPF